MPGLEELMGDAPSLVDADYTILKQRVDLDIDFAHQSLKGSTEITVQPRIKDLRQIRLHCRQCRPTSIQAGGITAEYTYEDPYRKLRLPGQPTVHQHDMLKSKIERSLQPAPEPELVIDLPAKLKIQELHVDPVTALPQYDGVPSLERQETDAMAVDTPTLQTPASHAPQFAPIKLFIEFEVSSFRDGLHWIGCDGHDKRYPYVYTKAELYPGNSSCIFPCVDDARMRCSWELCIRCPRTLGDAFRVRQPEQPSPSALVQPTANGDLEMRDAEGQASNLAQTSNEPEYTIDLNDEDANLDLTVVCVGDQIDDVVDSEDETRHSVTFVLNDTVTARHIGFAIGPFERVDLSSTREAEEEERLGQSAVKVEGYCLPGRADEVRNTCYPITKAVDYFGVTFGSFPFPSYQVLFVDDLVQDTVAVAGLSFCNSHLLFPEQIIEPLETNTRILIRAVADQWSGVSLIARESTDAWLVSGIAGFMADLYGKVLFGNNAYRWQQKLAADKVYEIDVDRPSIYDHGRILHLDPANRAFVDLKSALVLFILDRRLVKVSGSNGVQRIINRVFLSAKTGSLQNGELSTSEFLRTCERIAHAKLDSFFRQWILGAGCPIFYVQQKFNKKKLVVEMTIKQMQLERKTKPAFAPNNFMREVKEHVQEVWAPEVQPVFTGPMTIRIHEADGTPYEHIVDIKEQITKLDIPYNTKYKRLKRSRRQKERAMADGATGEGGEDALLYCLGDILDTPEEVRDWNLADWTAEDEEKMGQESYEWIRMDADFEWIGNIHLVMPLYMYVSQLQQDRDLVAQYESMRYLLGTNPHHVSLSILLRTLMDRRYFHGIRSMAAEGLATMARVDTARNDDTVMRIGQYHLQKAFEEMFCFPGEIMPRPNDWSDRKNYILQCAIPRALARLRDREGKVPMEVRKFFVDKLKFNDNTDNMYSDCHYVATLMECLADSLVASHREPQPTYQFHFGEEDDVVEPENPDEPFEREAIDEIERYRRIDEWDPTYHNIYSRTALDCLQKLTKGGLVKDKTKEVLLYTRSANADLVRLEAFRCLVETGLSQKMSMLRYILHSWADDTSPWFRNSLLAVFGEALGHLALGETEIVKPQAPLAPVETDGLILEQEVTSDVRHLEVTRKTSPDGAILALKTSLGEDAVFKQALWYAIAAPGTTLEEVAALCDIAALMFQPISSSRIVLKLPKMYRAENLGNGKISFVSRGPHRIAPRKELALADWQELQKLGLRYTGPLSAEAIQRRKSSLDEEKSLKQLRAEAQQQATSGQMLPPQITPTPTVERTGFKLSLGVGAATKRKASVDLTSQRAGSPKAQKLSKQQTPNGYAQSPPPAAPLKRSPSVSSRRGSTPNVKSNLAKKSGSRIVKLRFNQPAMTRAIELQKRARHPHTAGQLPAPPVLSEQPVAPRPMTPILLQQSSSSFGFAPGMLQSPTGNNFFAAPLTETPALNLGGFRSYGPPPEPAVVDADTPLTEVKQELVPETEAAVNSPMNGFPGHAHPSATGLSPPVEMKQETNPPPPHAEADHSMPPPPPPAAKPKLTLKLGRKPSTSGAGSPQ